MVEADHSIHVPNATFVAAGMQVYRAPRSCLNDVIASDLDRPADHIEIAVSGNGCLQAYGTSATELLQDKFVGTFSAALTSTHRIRSASIAFKEHMSNGLVRQQPILAR